MREAPRHLSVIKNSIEKKDILSAQREAHKLKSSAHNLGADHLSALAAEIESLCKATAAEEELQKAVNEAFSELNVVSRELPTEISRAIKSS